MCFLGLSTMRDSTLPIFEIRNEREHKARLDVGGVLGVSLGDIYVGEGHFTLVGAAERRV